MDFTAFIKIACFYVFVAASETLNGIFRTIYINKRLGIQNAKRVSMLSALTLCLLISYWYVPIIGISSDAGLVALGISLSLFMILFDVVLGRFVMKASWATIADEFNLAKGNLLGIGMVVMALCPLLAAKLQRFF
jgi:hypothetical protein